ncbi:hypothetical protein [Cerasicoccus arenae]|uniref:3-hydroxydecanoyl-ACP dehydratase n=1 Tax=Cerasicoccus arenae TaxID=424488 RepID=A0A8J3DED3_9BACT|nr:hypothetical protein [Cerasicoccus arenae]MBK1858325.1 hypothetical protein [Cerasicoccus arenae]GHB90787.1 3-hydroxydecanoyl-ACP dehydratase [Cerasicoccus arenae]
MNHAIPPISELIPHEPPMILIDRILELSADCVHAETTLQPGALDDNGTGVSSAWSLEIVAQACAALIGQHYRDQGFREGRLIKSSRWTLSTLHLPTAQLLTIHATIEAASDMGIFLFNGELRAGDTCLAEGQLTILAR